MTPKKAIKIIVKYLEIIEKQTQEVKVPLVVKKAAEYLANLM